MGLRSTGIVEVEEQLRVQLGLAGLGPELIAAVAARSEGVCFALRGFLVDAFRHVGQTDHFHAAVVAAATHAKVLFHSTFQVRLGLQRANYGPTCARIKHQPAV